MRTSGKFKFGYMGPKMAGKQTNWPNFKSLSSGDVFPYLKCKYNSKNHRDSWDRILVTEGGGVGALNGDPSKRHHLSVWNHMCIICAPICIRAWKKGFFFTYLAFKGFGLRNNFSMNKKQLQKKLLFSCLDSKAMRAKKNQNAWFVFASLLKQV